MIKWPIKNGQNSWTDIFIMNYPGGSVYLGCEIRNIYLCLSFIFIFVSIQLIVKIMGEFWRKYVEKTKGEPEGSCVMKAKWDEFQGENGE